MGQKIYPKHLQDLQARHHHCKEKLVGEPLLGVDYGSKFCGLAFSPDGICVFALSVMSTADLLSAMESVIAEKSIKKIVVGWPISPNNQENAVCKTIRQEVKKWERFGLPIVFQDEKYSTQEGLRFKTKKEKRADHLAAAKILEYFLEK